MAPRNFHPPKHLSPTLNVIIGVAGHIDHGKTELVKMLTGCDTDRLKEEKERGMSIETGYAPCYLQEGRIGIVDVPGHERFVRKMVAGAIGIDIAMLVIAADDGIMPQTIEHLDIIELLGIQNLIIALNKIDLIATEDIGSVSSEIRSFLQKTRFPEAAIIPVSAMTGDGLDVLRDIMTEMVKSVNRRKSNGVFRLPVDRIFSSHGHGTITTGVVISGSITANEMVEILPLGKTCRVRGLQVYLNDSTEAIAGQCVALNLANISHEEVERGFTITTPNRFSPCDCLTVRLRSSRFLEDSVRNSCRINFHTGTLEMPGKIRLLEGDELKPGEECFAQIFLDQPAPVFIRDRFIIRIPSPAKTIGGGVILETHSIRYKRMQESVLNRLAIRWKSIDSNESLIRVILDESNTVPLTLQELAKKAEINEPEASVCIDQLLQSGKILQITENQFFSAFVFPDICKNVVDGITVLHKNKSDQFAFSTVEIRNQVSLDEKVLKYVLEFLVSNNKLTVNAGLFRSAVAQNIDAKLLSLSHQIEIILKEERFQTSSPEQLAEKSKKPIRDVEKALKFLTDSEKIRRISEKVYLHDSHVQWAKQQLISIIKQKGSFESHEFKTIIGSSRKYAIPLLDYFDAIGVTKRIGDLRYLCG